MGTEGDSGLWPCGQIAAVFELKFGSFSPGFFAVIGNSDLGVGVGFQSRQAMWHQWEPGSQETHFQLTCMLTHSHVPCLFALGPHLALLRVCSW